MMEESGEQNSQAEVRMKAGLAGTIQELLGFIRKGLIVRGIVFLILGLLMMFKPGQTMLAITVTVGVFILIDGVAMLISSLKFHGDGKAFVLLNAVFLILLGLFSCTAPLKMNLIWVIMIGFWQLFNGIHCFGFRNTAGSSAVLSGICSIIAGLFLILMPLLGLMALMWVMGIISLVSGVSAILLGIRLKKAQKLNSTPHFEE